MRITMYTIKKYLQGAFLLLAGGYLCGCSHEELTDGGVVEQGEVHFFTSVATRATGAEQLTDNAKVRLYPYRSRAGVTDPMLQKDYSVTTNGGTQQLSPTTSSSSTTPTAMILPSGTFYFYAVTTNSVTEEVPTFATSNAVDGVPSATTGYASVKNGVDYLFAKTTKAITFGAPNINVPLEFSHKGTQVQLTILFSDKACAENAEAASNFELAEVHIQPTSDTDAKMFLYNGEIILNGNASAGVPGSDTDLKQMAVIKSGSSNGKIPAIQIATYHLLPLKAAVNQKMKITIAIKNLKIGEAQAANHTYTGKLDASGGWAAGTSNNYTLTLSGTEIKFSPVTVKPWSAGTSGGEVEVEESGNPTI